MNLREFTDRGLQEVHALLDRMKAGEVVTMSADFLHDDDFSRDVGVALSRPPTSFESRFAIALWVNREFDEELFSDRIGTVGVWTWLTMLLLDEIAPPKSDGTRKIGERSRYVLEPDNWQRYYRHLLAGPCRVMRAHWDELHVTQAILAGKPDVPGELYEQIASRQEVITSRALVRLTKRLYWDVTTKGLKRGRGGKGPGGARRLAKVLDQLDRTWDLAEMSDDCLIDLLPRREFARFVGKA